MAEYTKEQFRQQVQVGVEYIRREGIDPKDEVSYLTDHLWGTIGMVLDLKIKQVSKVHYYNEPAMAEYEQRLDIRADEHANGEL